MRPNEAAAYLATLTGEMVKIAEQAGLDALAHLYRMALLESEQTINSAEAAPDLARTE